MFLLKRKIPAVFILRHENVLDGFSLVMTCFLVVTRLQFVSGVKLFRCLSEVNYTEVFKTMPCWRFHRLVRWGVMNWDVLWSHHYHGGPDGIHIVGRFVIRGIIWRGYGIRGDQIRERLAYSFLANIGYSEE